MPTSGTFSADSYAYAVAPVTLALIEQAVARRVGPFRIDQQSSEGTRTATATAAYVDSLKTTANLGGVQDLWLLRRSAPAVDRQRIVQAYDPLQGLVAPDRPWSNIPVANETLEFHHLDPANELRPAVLAGLARCFFEDRVTIALSAAAAERDLTASIFWLTQQSQVRRVQYSTADISHPPHDQPWFNLYEAGGHVWLTGMPDEYPSSLLITALRPHTSWVNGGDSYTGPTQDNDVLTVNLEYAAAAGHVEAWRMFPARLQAAAQAGFQATQQQTAMEFTRLAGLHVRQRAEDVKLGSLFGRFHRRGRAI